MSNHGLELLQTVYDNVEEREPGKYMVQANTKFGLCIDGLGVVVEPIYNTGVIRSHYSIFYTGAQSRLPIPGSGGSYSKDKSIVLFHCKPEQPLEIDAGNGVIEHSSSGFSILEIKHMDGENTYIDLYDVTTGQKLCSTLDTTQRKLRLNQYIILGYTEKNEAGKDVYYGLTQDFKLGKIEDLLKEKYKDIKYDTKSRRYIGIDENGREIRLNQAGQLY